MVDRYADRSCAHNETIDRLLARGAILRTHVVRPTWHFVLPADLRWLLNLTGPRVDALNASMYRRLQLDGKRAKALI